MYTCTIITHSVQHATARVAAHTCTTPPTHGQGPHFLIHSLRDSKHSHVHHVNSSRKSSASKHSHMLLNEPKSVVECTLLSTHEEND